MSVDATPRRTPAWRIVVIVVAVLALLGVLGGVLVWRLTGGAADAANAFLQTTATAGPDAAWKTASPAFQQNTPTATWASFARQSGLTGYSSASWRSREINNNMAHLEGSVTTNTGGTIPLTVELVRGGSGWQVQLVRTPVSGAQLDPGGVAGPAAGTTPALSGGPVVAPPVQAPAAGPASSWNGAPSTAANTAMVPGAKVAGVCMTELQEQAGIKFDSIQCLAGLPPQVGATTQCAIAKGLQKGTMTVTVTAADPATGKVDFHCTPGNPT